MKNLPLWTQQGVYRLAHSVKTSNLLPLLLLFVITLASVWLAALFYVKRDVYPYGLAFMQSSAFFVICTCIVFALEWLSCLPIPDETITCKTRKASYIELDIFNLLYMLLSMGIILETLFLFLSDVPGIIGIGWATIFATGSVLAAVPYLAKTIARKVTFSPDILHSIASEY